MCFTGHEGHATADRLGLLLAHSGAVILLQESANRYHFSMRLKPWVHYVPVGYNNWDLTEKVEWLVAHDKEAQQIVKNARNFGLSFLRVEDTICYAASALEAVAEIERGSDVLQHFNSSTAFGRNYENHIRGPGGDKQ